MSNDQYPFIICHGRCHRYVNTKNYKSASIHPLKIAVALQSSSLFALRANVLITVKENKKILKAVFSTFFRSKIIQNMAYVDSK